MKDVAFLVYAPLRRRRKNNSFDGNDNFGAKVIESVLTDKGVDVGFCTPDNAHRHKVVLVSFTSTYDMIAFYQSVVMLPSWQKGKRSFKVLAGGFGMQNPTVVRNYIDYAAFGRAHDWVFGVVDSLLGDNEPLAHPSLMDMQQFNSVVFHQSPLLSVDLDGRLFSENFTGCPLKCKFCHYTYARKYDDSRETRGSYVQELLSGGGTPELTWDQLFTWGKKIGRARVAIDGFSERLRWLYGKKISKADIINGLECIGEYEGNTVLLTYNIANFPHETEEDANELYDALKQTSPKNRVIFVLHSTPFRPSLATPMQWEPVNLFPDWSKQRARIIIEKPTLRAVHSFTLETPYSHLCNVIVERATIETDTLFHAIAVNKYLNTARHDKRLIAVRNEFDIEPYIKEYDFDEPHPAQFLSSYIATPVLRRIAGKMRQDARNASYTLKGKSLVQVRLAQADQGTAVNA